MQSLKKIHALAQMKVPLNRPLQIWPLKTCNKDISKTITASSLKLSQLIEDDD